MYVEVIAFFLGSSLLLYTVFAGADFGAGILEAFRGKKLKEKQREIISRAIGPVWEANHVWLILAIVILFVGFPKAFSALSVTFHIPITLMLLGVILRGSAFTFRSYDAVRDDSQKIYSFIFILSSFLTPFMLGVVAGGIALGRSAAPEAGFKKAFIEPWANLFACTVGVFTCVLFAFLAAVYLIGESEEREVKKIFIKRALLLNAMAIVVGLLVFLCAQIDGLNLAEWFFSERVSLACMLGATLILLPLWTSIDQAHYRLAAILAAAQVGIVLLGWLSLQFPVLIRQDSQALTIYNASAPVETLRALLYALLIGSALIFPSLVYLLKIFKFREN